MTTDRLAALEVILEEEMLAGHMTVNAARRVGDWAAGVTVAQPAEDAKQAAYDARMARITAAVNAHVPQPAATLHSCWDNHEGEDGGHADGSPCHDKATPLYAQPAPDRLAALLPAAIWPNMLVPPWGPSDYADIAARLAAASVTVAATLPPHTRLVLMDDNLLEQIGTRTDDGYRITAEWGEQRPEGWYEPVFTVHYDEPFAQPTPDAPHGGEIDHSGMGHAYLRSHPDTPMVHRLGDPCGYCDRDPQPAPDALRAAAQAMLDAAATQDQWDQSFRDAQAALSAALGERRPE